MALLSFLFDNTNRCCPSKMMNQQFGIVLEPEDLLSPLTVLRHLMHCPEGYIRNWKSAASEQDSGSTVTFDNEKFQVSLDVQQFEPEDISIKVTGDNQVTVEAKHDEKSVEYGQIFRHFIRKYTIPKNCDVSRIESKLSSDGVLSIIAPTIDAKKIEHQNISITQTGEPAKVVETKDNVDKQ